MAWRVPRQGPGGRGCKSLPRGTAPYRGLLGFIKWSIVSSATLAPSSACIRFAPAGFDARHGGLHGAQVKAAGKGSATATFVRAVGAAVFFRSLASAGPFGGGNRAPVWHPSSSPGVHCVFRQRGGAFSATAGLIVEEGGLGLDGRGEAPIDSTGLVTAPLVPLPLSAKQTIVSDVHICSIYAITDSGWR